MCFLGSPSLTASSFDTCPEVTFTCYATDMPGGTLRWFFDDSVSALYNFFADDSYPLSVDPIEDSLIGSVDIQIISASLNEDDADLTTFNSTVRANISALQAVGITSISCGSIGTRGTLDISFNNSNG